MAKLSGDGGPPRFSVSAKLGPVFPELPSSPGDDRFGLNEYQHLAPPRPVAGQPGPEDAIGRDNPGSSAGALIDTDLVSEGEDLHLEGDARPEEISNGVV